MNIVSYLKDIYGYGTPIFLKDIRIGRKSKTAIRKELSRAVKEKEIIRRSQGVYYFKEDKEFPRLVSFEDIITKKYVRDDYGIPGMDFFVYGYFSGLTFLNHFGISQQVPAILEITTNNTSCKRMININGRRAIIRKAKTEINYQNWKILQFLEMFYLLNEDDVKEYKESLAKYIEKNFTKLDFTNYIRFFSNKIMKLIVEGGLIHAFR